MSRARVGAWLHHDFAKLGTTCLVDAAWPYFARSNISGASCDPHVSHGPCDMKFNSGIAVTPFILLKVAQLVGGIRTGTRQKHHQRCSLVTTATSVGDCLRSAQKSGSFLLSWGLKSGWDALSKLNQKHPEAREACFQHNSALENHKCECIFWYFLKAFRWIRFCFFNE